MTKQLLGTRKQKLRAAKIGSPYAPKWHGRNRDKWFWMGRPRPPRPAQKPKEKK